MLSFITNLFTSSSTTIRLAMYITILSMIGGGVLWGYNSVYNAGYDSAKVEVLEAANITQRAIEAKYEANIKQLSTELSSASNAHENSKGLAIKLQKELNDRPYLEIVREIPKIDTNCDDLGGDFDRLFKSIVGEAPSIPNE